MDQRPLPPLTVPAGMVEQLQCLTGSVLIPARERGMGNGGMGLKKEHGVLICPYWRGVPFSPLEECPAVVHARLQC